MAVFFSDLFHGFIWSSTQSILHYLAYKSNWFWSQMAIEKNLCNRICRYMFWTCPPVLPDLPPEIHRSPTFQDRCLDGDSPWPLHAAFVGGQPLHPTNVTTSSLSSHGKIWNRDRQTDELRYILHLVKWWWIFRRRNMQKHSATMHLPGDLYTDKVLFCPSIFQAQATCSLSCSKLQLGNGTKYWEKDGHGMLQ